MRWVGSVEPRDEEAAAKLRARRLGFSDGQAGREPQSREAVYMHAYRRGVEAREKGGE